MNDPLWLAQLAYFADIFDVLNRLILSLQGREVTVFKVDDGISALCKKLTLWCERIRRREFESFPTLSEFLETNHSHIDDGTFDLFRTHSTNLSEQLREYFPEPDSSLEWTRQPFAPLNHDAIDKSGLSERNVNSLIELNSDGALRAQLSETSRVNSRLPVRAEFNDISNVALKHLLRSPTTYLCELYSWLVFSLAVLFLTTAVFYVGYVLRRIFNGFV